MAVFGTLAFGVTSADAASRLLRIGGCFSNLAVSGCRTLAGIDGPGRSAFSPDGKQLYVAARDSDALLIFDRDPSSGAITRRSQCFGAASGCTPVALLDVPSAVAVTPDGANLYVVTADPGSGLKEDALLIFVRSADGSLGFSGCISEGTTCQVTPRSSINSNWQVIATNDAVLVAGFGANAVTAFSRSGNTLTYLNCIGDAAGCATDHDRLTNPTDLELTPNGKWLVVTSYNQPSRVHVVQRNTDGTLTARSDAASCATSGSATNCGSAPATAETTGSAMSADGTHVYTSSRYTFGGGEAVNLFDLDQTNGTLTYRSGGCWQGYEPLASGCTRVAALQGLNDIAISPDGGHVFAASLDDGGHLVAFDRAANGMLTPQPLPDGCLGAGGGCAPLLAGSPVFYLTPSLDSNSLYASGEPFNTAATRLWALHLDRPPVCSDVTTPVAHNSATAFRLTCSDPDGDPLSISAAAPSHGTLSAVQGDGTVIYQPAVGFSGADSFTFTATARNLASAPATATLNVAAVPATGGGGTTPGGGTPPGGGGPIPPPRQISSKISARWATRGSVTRVRRIIVRNLPAGAMVEVICVAPRKARGACPFKRRKGTVRIGQANLTGLFRKKRLRAGAVVEIRITVPGMIGQAVKYKMRRNRLPVSSHFCVQPGASAATRC